jgi:hypothetical protein
MQRIIRRQASTAEPAGAADPTLEKRGERLTRIGGTAPQAHSARLVKGIRLSDPMFDRLQTAAAIYVWHSLSQGHPGRSFVLSASVLEDYSADVLALPNRTPNGLLLPRRETFLSFNLVQQALTAAIVELGIDAPFEAVQSPCNVRVVAGAANAEADNRPYAASKIHTDVWYGEPLRSILFNLPLLGDPAAVAMDFLEPDEFPVALQGVLADYNDGREISQRAARLPMSFELGVLYMSDSLSLHQTMRRGPGIRLSLDWRAIPRERLAGEADEKVQSRATYVPTDIWRQGGSTLVFTDGDPIDGFQRRARGEEVTPADIKIVPIGSA